MPSLSSSFVAQSLHALRTPDTSILQGGVAVRSMMSIKIPNHMKSIKPVRKIEYDGDHKIDSLVIGNFGDVDFIAKGNFELSGLIYSKKSVAFTIIGQGLIRFHGVCQKLTIHLVKGDCTLDFSELTCAEVCCVSLRDNSTTMIGPTKLISRANLQDKAVLKYKGTPRLQNYTLSGSSRIESLEPMAAAS